MQDDSPGGPLAGLRILELTEIIAGPLGGMLLADMGADVIKVEPPWGEPWRIYGQFAPLESKNFQALNRGKRSITLDLNHEAAREALHRVVRDCDAVLINYRPDVPARLGADYDTLSAIRPDLVYVDCTAFGRRGPWADKPGYDIVVQAAAGLTGGAARFREDGDPEQGAPLAVADFTTAYAIAWGACAALLHRERTGQGQLVETSLLANALVMQGSSFMSHPVADASLRTPMKEELKSVRARGGGYAEMARARRARWDARRAGNVYYRNFYTQDGAIAVGCLSPTLRQKLRDALDIEYDPLDDDPGYEPTSPGAVEFGRNLIEYVVALLATKPSAHWIELFERHGVPASPIKFIEELDSEPQILENEYVVEVEHDLSGPQRMAAPPLKLSASPAHVRAASPPLGRDTDSILEGAGYSADEVRALREAGAIR